MKKCILLVIALSLYMTGASAGLLNDGDFQFVPFGDAPNVDAPAGSWHFPDSYVAAGLAETNAAEFRIVSDPVSPKLGCSLGLVAAASLAGNQHLVNILDQAVTEDGGRVQVDFDIYVRPGKGGGSVYLGNGTYGARGPQVAWFADGRIVTVDQFGPQETQVTSYPRGVWQRVRLVVDLANASYSFYWAVRGYSLVLLGENLSFRTGPQSSLDRITVARFDLGEDVDAIYDNFNVQVVDPIILPSLPDSVIIPPSTYQTNLEVEVAGMPPFSYQWYRDGEELESETNAGLTVAEPDLAVHFYRVVVSNPVGWAEAWVSVVQGLQPLLLSGPQPAKVNLGEQVVLGSQVIGSYVLGLGPYPRPTPIYQWEKDTVALDYEYSGNLSIADAHWNDAGSYRLSVSNVWGGAISPAAALQVLPWGRSTIQPLSTAEMSISFPSAPGFRYVTESSSNLAVGSWTAIMTNNGTGDVLSVTNHSIYPAVFYRIRVE